MARLLVKTGGLNLAVLELRLGVNRVGRDPKSDFALNHPTISTHHCELLLSADGVVLHDCDSTNGSFVNEQPVREVWLEPGHCVRLGDVELSVESTEANVFVPNIERATPPLPPVVLADGAMLCPRHPEQQATFKCTNCSEIMCSGCVRMMRIKGGKPLFLCRTCHQKCDRLSGDANKVKKSFFGMLQETVRLKFGRGKPKE